MVVDPDAPARLLPASISRWATRMERLHPWWPVTSVVVYCVFVFAVMLYFRTDASLLPHYLAVMALFALQSVATQNAKDAHLRGDTPPDWLTHPDVVLRYIGQFAVCQLFFSVTLFTCFFQSIPGRPLFHLVLLLIYLAVGAAGVITYPLLIRRGLADPLLALLIPHAAVPSDWVTLSIPLLLITILAVLLAAVTGFNARMGWVFLIMYLVLFAAGLALREFLAAWVDLRCLYFRLTK